MTQRKIEWLFFDIGSTLVDESACHEHRLKQLAAQEGAPDIYALNEMTAESARRLGSGYKEAAARYGLALPPWPSHMERLYPGVPAALEYLSGRYRLGIIANQLPGAEKRLNDFGILRYFDAVISSADEGVSKPDPEIFRRALMRTGCRPENAVMAGDRPDNDIFPAKALGMGTIWVKQGMYACADPSLFPVMPDICLDGINEITHHL